MADENRTDQSAAGDGEGTQTQQTTETSGGAEATASQPKRVFVGDRWMTAEELAAERAEMQRRLAEQKPEERTMARMTQEPAWASAMREQGVDESEVQRLIEQDQARIDSTVRGAIHDELGKLTQQAQTAQTAMSSAVKGYKEDHPEFDQSAMNEFVADNPDVKEVVDALNSQGKYGQAVDYAWSKRLLSNAGNTVSTRSRQNARVPNAPATPRQQREEAQAADGAGGGKKNIPKEVLEGVEYNADKQSILNYMRHRRQGTALDLDAEPPVNISRR